jgi:hypothetical protein
VHKALHQQEPDGGSNKHSENEQNDNRWCETQHGNQPRVGHELSEPSPEGDLTPDGRDEHEGKQTKAQGGMFAAWKASPGFVRIMICFHLISALPTKLQTMRLISGRRRFDAVGVLSNEIKLDHSFHLRNLDGISRQARMARVAAAAPALFSLTPAFRPVYNPHTSQ